MKLSQLISLLLFTRLVEPKFVQRVQHVKIVPKDGYSNITHLANPGIKNTLLGTDAPHLSSLSGTTSAPESISSSSESADGKTSSHVTEVSTSIVFIGSLEPELLPTSAIGTEISKTSKTIAPTVSVETNLTTESKAETVFTHTITSSGITRNLTTMTGTSTTQTHLATVPEPSERYSKTTPLLNPSLMSGRPMTISQSSSRTSENPKFTQSISSSERSTVTIINNSSLPAKETATDTSLSTTDFVSSDTSQTLSSATTIALTTSPTRAISSPVKETSPTKKAASTNSSSTINALAPSSITKALIPPDTPSARVSRPMKDPTFTTTTLAPSTTKYLLPPDTSRVTAPSPTLMLQDDYTRNLITANNLNGLFATLNTSSPCNSSLQIACVGGAEASCSANNRFEIVKTCDQESICVAVPQRGTYGPRIGCINRKTAGAILGQDLNAKISAISSSPGQTSSLLSNPMISYMTFSSSASRTLPLTQNIQNTALPLTRTTAITIIPVSKTPAVKDTDTVTVTITNTETETKTQTQIETEREIVTVYNCRLIK